MNLKIGDRVEIKGTKSEVEGQRGVIDEIIPMHYQPFYCTKVLVKLDHNKEVVALRTDWVIKI